MTDISSPVQGAVPVTITREPLAHLDETGRPHLLLDHLRAVGDLAASFAERLGAAAWARLAGLWHDLGKYANNFQHMIREANGFAAHIEGDVSGPRDHSTAGAIHALRALGPEGLPIMFAIAGHHAGLSNRADLLDRWIRRAATATSADEALASPQRAPRKAEGTPARAVSRRRARGA